MDNLSLEEREQLIKSCSPKSKTLKNVTLAFITGGAICLFAELLRSLFLSLGLGVDDAQLLSTLSIVVIGGALTALGVFDKIAKYSGAGTLVPITGFSNSIVSAAIDSQSEGYISGVGSKIFTIAGPVILYGTVCGVIYGIIYFIYTII